MKRLALIIICLIILIVLVVLVIGLLQPTKHSVTRSIHLKQSPESVFALLNDPAKLPTWSSGIAKVVTLPNRDGKPVARLTMKWGGMEMLATELENTPPHRLVTAMRKEGGPTFGTWTYDIRAEGDGCRISITEDGELKNPLYRVMARVRGLDATVTRTLSDLATKFGETSAVQME
jgi:uncharacterized protein YndB with AHSA1/START domain